MTALRNRIGKRSAPEAGLLLLLATASLANCAFGQVVYSLNERNGINASAFDPRTELLKPVPGSPFSAGRNPSAIALSPLGKFVYVANSGSGDISAYSINSATGALTAVALSPFPAHTAPAGLAIHPSGKFAYVTNSGSNDVSGYRIDAISGALSAIGGSPFSAGMAPTGVAVDPKGRFLYVANSRNGSVAGFAIDSETGFLTPVPGTSFAAGKNPGSIAIDPSGRFAYVTSEDAVNGSIWAFAINALSGELTAIAGSPLAVAGGPISIAVNPTGKSIYIAVGGELATYSLDAKTGALTLVPGSRVPSRLGAGIAVDSHGSFVYEANNLSNHHIAAHVIDAKSGALVPGSAAADESISTNTVRAGAKAASSNTVRLVVNKAPLTGSPLLTGFTTGTLRNNFTGGFGLRFTVGTTPITVTALGRIYVLGNSGTHVVKLVKVSDGSDVPNGSVSISLPLGTAGQFAFVALASPITLDANVTYDLVSSEDNGGDQFYDLTPVTPTNVATVNSGVAYGPGIGYVGVGPANESYVPVNLLYLSGTPPAVSISAPAAGATVSGNNLTVSATASAGSGLSVTSVQFQVDNVNQGAPVTSSPYNLVLDTTKLSNATHVLTAIATDSGDNSATSAPVSVTVNNNPTATITAPAAGANVSGNNVTLSATAAAVTGLSVTQVQFKVDNVNQGGPVTSSPYKVTLDSTTLSNAVHNVVAVVTDSANNTGTSLPVSFTVNNSTTTVAITTPANNATVSGPISIIATATAGAGLTISNVQFKVDGNNQGAPVTVSPYTISLDTTTLVNGTHTLVATATDSASTTASSSPITITVSNGVPPPSGTALVTGFSTGTLRNNFTGGFGMRFTVGATALNVTSLGRIYITGNSASHVVKLVKSSDGTDVPGGSVTISMPSGTAGQFAYAPLATPVTLAVNTTYDLISTEINGGDQFYDLGPVTTTSAVTVNSGVVLGPGIGYVPVGTPSHSYVPVSLLYTAAGTPPSVSITAPSAGATVSGNNLTVSATATAGTGLNVTSVQFQVDNVNQGAPVTTAPYHIVLDTTKLTNTTHSLTAIAVDSGNNSSTSAPVSITVNNNPTVSITAPAPGATVSGSTVPVTATAIAATGLTISSVQFKVDNVNQGAPVTSSPYTITLDSTTLSNATHTVTAVATDSVNNTATSSPVNFTVNNSSTTVAISTPANGANVSGPIQVTATATAGASLTIKNVQFKVDGNNQGAPVTVSPYSITLDTTTLANGQHTLLAVATDSANTTASSTPITITVNNGAPQPSGTALITGFSSGTLRNNFTGSFGMRFTVGSVNLNVTALGRIYIAGNSSSHELKLVNVSDGSDVPGGTVTLSLPSGVAGQFAYAQLASPITLAANTAYDLISAETNAGDQFYDLGPVTATSAVTVNSGVAFASGIGFHAVGLPNNSFVPVNLLYTLAGAPPMVAITAPAAGAIVSGNNVAVSATATAFTGLAITSVQFRVDGVNQGSPVTTSPYSITLDATKLSNGSHSLTALATDSGNNTNTSSPVNITVNNNPTVTITAPVSGATVSGSTVALTATAVPATGLTIASVQFKVDNVNQGSPVTTSPYTVTLDSTQLTNATHSVVAVVTDSANNSGTSSSVSFTVNNSATTVTVTAPALAATVSGTINLTATATAGAGLTISNVQFKLDGSNFGGPIVASPYTISLDTTTLSNGSHSVVAVATDSASNPASSTPVNFMVSNNATPPPSGTPLVTGFSSGPLRNNFTGGFGMRFTVGAVPISVTALGRIYIAGNTGSHIVKLVKVSDGSDIPGGSVVVTLPAGNAGQFSYVALPAPITLDSNTAYDLISIEVNGGDQFSDLGPVTASGAVTVTSGIAFAQGVGYIAVGPPNESYVPVSLLYSLAP